MAGRLGQLERYCQRDTEALAELVTQQWVRVAGGGGTGRLSVNAMITGGNQASPSDGTDGKRPAATPPDTERPAKHARTAAPADTPPRPCAGVRRAEGGPEDEPPAQRARGHAATDETGSGRGKRHRPVRDYDEENRRGPRRAPHARVRRVVGHKRSRVETKHTIAVGPVTIHRVVAGRYEWRDAGYSDRRAKKAKVWQGSRIWDPGD